MNFEDSFTFTKAITPRLTTASFARAKAKFGEQAFRVVRTYREGNKVTVVYGVTGRNLVALGLYRELVG